MQRLQYWALSMFLMLAAFQISAQHTLHDALVLKQYSGMAVENGINRAILMETAMTEDENGDLVLRSDVAAVLAKYARISANELTQGDINRAFGADSRNPFIRIAFPSMSGIEKTAKIQSPSTQSSPGNPVGFLVDGLARFLVKRTKAELTLAFFEDFKAEVEKDPILQDFFPITRQMLLAIDSEVYQFQIYLDALRDAFIADLKVLPGALEAYLRDADETILKPAQQAVAIDFFHIVQSVLDGVPPPDIIRYCANPDSSAIQAQGGSIVDLKNMAAGLQTLNLFSESVFNPNTGKWYTGKEINAALKDTATLQLYMGLLWMQSKFISVDFKNGLKIADLIGNAATATSVMDGWRKEMASFGQLGADWQIVLQNRPGVGAQMSEEVEIPLLDNFYRALQIFGRLMESVNTVYMLGNPKAIPPIDPANIQLIQQIGGLNFNICRKNYSAAIGNTAAILDICLGDKFKGKSTFLRYGSFIGAVADAESADEVENALDMFALPAGSSKAKKGPDKFSIALNAYTGVNAAAERFKNTSTSYGVAGIAAPVGFSFNWGQNWGSEPGCVGLFIPVIDVGAVFAYRFKDDGVDNLPPMEWKNIIAPGLYFVMDPPVGKLPLTIGLGGQFGPLLRKVDNGGNLRNQEVGAYRLGGFITCDIPINFFKLRGDR